MTGLTLIMLFGTAVLLMLAKCSWDACNEHLAVLLTVFACCTGYVAYWGNSDEYRKQRALDDRQKKEQALKDQVPYVISESPDGCKVYTFKANNRWHYFTRCPNSQTSTDSAQVVRSGKSSRTEYTTITAGEK